MPSARVFSSKARGARTEPKLQRYREKRDLRASGEPDDSPVPLGKRKVPTFRFVIQKHDATGLHYDFRLEMEGVLKSWAVPKGLPTKPGVRALAVEVEDHPLDYGSFEGVIPPGNYGAGTVMLWDHGVYSAKGTSPKAAYQEGKIHLALSGEKCIGEWTLVRLPKKEEGRINWLVLKNRDAKGSSRIKVPLDVSVKTGRRMQEIAETTEVKPTRAGGTAPVRKLARRPRRMESPAASKRATAAELSSKFVEPMKALAVAEIPPGDWLLEIKFDGYRALAIFEKGRIDLWSRNGNLLSVDFPEILLSLETLGCEDTVLDGEIVALDSQGRPRFQLLQGLGKSTDRPPIFYYVFDLLRLRGKSYLDQAIEIRRAALGELVKKPPAALRLSPTFDQDAKILFESSRKQGFEGIVAKARGSLYEVGRRTGSWLKCRFAHDQEFVIGGYTPPQGARPYFGAILVGYYEGDRLLFAGKVGTGFDQKLLKSLYGSFGPLKTEQCPFANLPQPRKPRFGQGMTLSAMNEVSWLAPTLVAQIRFSEWTREGSLRHPVFLGLRKDKLAKDVVREILAGEEKSS